MEFAAAMDSCWLLTSQMTRLLSSWPPRDARYFSSLEKLRDWM